MKIKFNNFLTPSLFIFMIAFLNSCNWDSETFTCEDFGLYATVERIDSDHFRIYFHDTRENKNLDFIEIYYSVSTEQSPAIDINFNKDNPYVLNIKDYGECVEKVKSSRYDLIVSKQIKKNKNRVNSDDYIGANDKEYSDNDYEWSDSTIINHEYIKYKFEPAFFEVSVYKNGSIYLGAAHIIK